MRAIKIDPAAKTVTKIDVKNPNRSLRGFYDIIGCDLIQLVEIDRSIVMACDEEGKLKPVAGAFTFFGSEQLVIAGTAVIIGGNGNRFKALRENKASFDMIVQWVDSADVPEPKFTNERN